MSDQALQRQTSIPAAATLQAKNEVEFTPFGSDDKIKLSLAVIRNYIAVPTKEKDLPDDRNCMRFMMLCRSRRLNPFEGDAYMIGFRKGGDDGNIEWSLITSQSAFMKRAELHPEFDGFESGIIIKDSEDRFIEREGDFAWPGDVVMGGWCAVHFKTRKFPVRKKVQLSTYKKNFGVWLTDPAGMICKVAEVHALRDAFPTSLGGMMLREEAMEIPAEVIATREAKRPEFAQGLPAPQLADSPGTTPVRTNEKKQALTPRRAQDDPNRVTAPPETQNTPQTPPVNAQTPSGERLAPEDDEAEAAAGLAPQGQPATGPVTQQANPAATASNTGTTTAPAPPVKPIGEFKPRDGESIPLVAVRRWLHNEGHTEAELLKVLVNNKAAKLGQKLAELSEAKLDNCFRAKATLLTQMRQQPAQPAQ